MIDGCKEKERQRWVCGSGCCENLKEGSARCKMLLAEKFERKGSRERESKRNCTPVEI
jgi:hypothetical protein